MNNQQRAVQARVYGKVQGVGYRIWAKGAAVELGLAGWVRNETDGSV
ncbi:MAG: acylphosphatase, partial [Mesorhizobium sp.]